jgi:hypothetical protein
MINTDKYEGHIQGEWRDTIHEGAKSHTICAGDVMICTVSPNEATANLVADAPKLLAEVKRLQRYEREHKELWDIIANFSPKDSEEDDDIHEQWLESVSQGYMGSVYDYVMMKQEEMIE